jgi:hypothetical protein
MFVKLEAQIKSLSKQEQDFITLAEQLVSSVFDDEDRRMVHRKILEIQGTRQLMEQTLAKKKEIYKNQIMGMEQQLQARQQALETFDKERKIFQQFPDVLEFFARKQSRLIETLTAIRDQLQQ